MNEHGKIIRTIAVVRPKMKIRTGVSDGELGQKFCRTPHDILSQMGETIFEISRRRAMAGFRFVSDALLFGRHC